MFGKSIVMATIPVDNLERAVSFYENTLGLKRGKSFPNGVRMQSSPKSFIALFRKPKTNDGHTVAWFSVQDFDKTVSNLKAKGIKFDEYDMPGFSSLGGGIYKFGSTKVGWFNDSEGNILCVSGDW
jgi:catechol 2,3-dioxygenase-like lactoylglutathione lyase family enzyme